VQPLSALDPAALPQMSFVIPNMCDDAHGLTSTQLATLPYQNCVTGSTALLQRGDAWLQAHVPAWTAAGADVFITWDEGTGTAGVNGTTGGGRIAALLTGPGVTPGQDSAPYSHYSVLAGIENLYGLPLLASAASASPLTFPAGGGVSAPPTVTITAPAAGSTASGIVTVSGTAQGQGADIAQVEAGVDGGAWQLAVGTTNWTATIDTTVLANGAHAINVRATDTNGTVGMASVAVTVSNTGATSCPAAPAGVTELSGNVGLENSQSGWTVVYNGNSQLSRVEPAGGSYDGLWALRAGLKAGTSGAAGVKNGNPIWVPGPPGLATTAGQAYTGSAFVQASTVGEKVSLVVKETTTGGATVGSHTTSVTLTDTAWHGISSAYTAKATGNLIRYSLYAANLASSSQSFLADCLSLQTP
jgi:hypothetical protein